MCGICGIFHLDGARPIDSRVLLAMRDIQKHRGPDDQGLFVDGGVGLGHTRLKVIDLVTGQQPMTNEDGSIVLVYNGEIYNYRELNRDLVARGHRFRSHCDTETILHVYEEYGPDCVEHFNGMFAFAIWDSRRRRLVLARDRLGVKPLYYCHCNGSLLFASELKALLVCPEVTRTVDPRAVEAFMTFGYVPGPLTMLDGVSKLLPGHVLVAEGGSIRTRPYWDLRFATARHGDLEDATAALEDLLSDSVRLRLRSDVPLGVFLSGGVDSSLVTALMTKISGRPVEAFSVAYGEHRDFNEFDHADVVAREFGARHHRLMLSPRTFAERLPEFVWHMDEPVTDSASVSLFCLSELAKQHVTVILSGEGADEVFAGYGIYWKMQLLELYHRILPGPLRRLLLGPLPARFGRLRKWVELAERPGDRRYAGVSHFLTQPAKAPLYSRDFLGSLGEWSALDLLTPYLERVRNRPLLDRMLYLDTKVWLVDDILTKADKMTMAHALELRVPFLDYRLVELGASFPSDFKLRGTQTKRILKLVAEKHLPRSIVYRRKMGFPTPLSDMFKYELRDHIHQVLTDSVAFARGYFDPLYVRRCVEEHTSGARDHHRLLWSLLVLEAWYRTFLDRSREQIPQAMGPLASPSPPVRLSRPARNPRVLFVSNLYPNPRQPTRGVFNYHTVHSLAPHLELQVMAPVSWYPFSGKLRGIPPSEHDDGIPVLHPRAFYTPGVLRSRHGDFFYHSLAKPVRRLRSSFPFDLLYGSWVYPDGFGAMKLARDFNVPYVLHALGSDINDYLDRPDRLPRIQAALKNASAVICVSKALRDRILAKGIDPDILHVVYDGVDTDLFRPRDRRECRAQLGLPLEPRIILFVGSLLPVKGPEYLLEAVARLAAGSSEPFHVVLVGQGSCLRRLRSLARRLGLGDRLTFAGPRPHDEIAAWMGAADVFCLPSISEGLPNVALEALASGRPVVASRVGGLPEIVTDDSRGFLVPPASPEELAQALARALETTWDPQALHAAALPFSWAEHGQRIADIVGSVLSQRSS